MNIHCTIVTYAVDITRLVENLAGPEVSFHIYMHSRREEARKVIQLFTQYEYATAITLHDFGVNRGLARSWNDGLIEAYQEGADVAILVNDDMQATYGDLYKLAQAACGGREFGVVQAEGFDGNMQRKQAMNFGFCAMNPIALETVGYFDENLFPIYFEDTDYSLRCGRAGVRFATIGETEIVHLGSQTVKLVPELASQNNATFHANGAYYSAKWGGNPGQETFQVPFNDPAFGWQIAASQRHDPYPGHGRQDKEIVKL